MTRQNANTNISLVDVVKISISQMAIDIQEVTSITYGISDL